MAIKKKKTFEKVIAPFEKMARDLQTLIDQNTAETHRLKEERRKIEETVNDLNIESDKAKKVADRIADLLK